jgi:hypothetical protein
VASLLRPTYTRPIPPGAEVVTHKGKPHARFKGDDGKTVLAPLTKDGKRYRVKAEKWYGQYTDDAGVLRRVPLSTDKTVAGQMLNECSGAVADAPGESWKDINGCLLRGSRGLPGGGPLARLLRPRIRPPLRAARRIY